MKKIYFSVLSLFLGLNSFQAQTWTNVGTSASQSSAIAVSGSDVYAGGNFINGSDVFSFGKYSNGQWTALGNWKGINGGIGSVYAALVLGDNLYVAGLFSNGAGIAEMDGVGRFHIPTQTWHAMGTGIASGFINAMATDGTNIYIGGKFSEVSGVANTQFLAKWDGTSWSPVGAGISGGNPNFNSINALEYKDGNLFIGSNFENMNNIPEADYVLKYDGTSYGAHGLGTGWVGAVYDFGFSPSGDLYAVGEFSSRVVKFNGNLWLPVGSGIAGHVYSIDFFQNEVYIGGNFPNVGGDVTASYIAKFDGTNWVSVAGGLNGKVNKLLATSDKLYVVGNFTDAGGNTVNDYIVTYGTGGSSASLINLSKEKISVYPNPTSSIFHVNVEETYNFSLISLTGQTLMNGEISKNANVIDVEQVNSGRYILKLENDKEVVYKQVQVN